MNTKWKEWLGFSFVGKNEINNREVIVEEIPEEAVGIYRIRSVEHLFWVAKMVNEGICNFQNKTIKLETDIDLNEYLWKPIGKTMQTSFSGIFDGGGKRISGVRIDSSEPYVGFFGVVRGINKLVTAEIYYLNLLEVHIIGNENCNYAGGLVGYAQEGVRIDRCFVNGTIKEAYCAGGIIGCADDCVSVRNCQCSGKVEGREITGALVGRLVTNSLVINCGNFMNDLHGRPEESIVGNQDDTSIIK